MYIFITKKELSYKFSFVLPLYYKNHFTMHQFQHISYRINNKNLDFILIWMLKTISLLLNWGLKHLITWGSKVFYSFHSFYVVMHQVLKVLFSVDEFCRSLFVLLTFFFGTLFCLSLCDWSILITDLISSKSSYISKVRISSMSNSTMTGTTSGQEQPVLKYISLLKA